MLAAAHRSGSKEVQAMEDEVDVELEGFVNAVQVSCDALAPQPVRSRVSERE